MRKLLLVTALIITAAVIVGCGKGPQNLTAASKGACYSVANGTWQGVGHPTNIVSLTDQCTGTGSFCNEVFTYQPQSDGLHAIVVVSQTNGGPNCLPIGASTITSTMIANQNNNQMAVTVNPAGPFVQDNFNRLSGP